MPEILLNQTPVLGGAGTVYQRKEGGPWYLYFWVKSERKRFRQSLETTDRPLAIRTAEQLVLDALARQQVGQKVLSSSLGEVIEKWEVLQRDRLARGEIRSAEYIRYLAATFRKQLGGCFGLDTPISALKQEDAVLDGSAFLLARSPQLVLLLVVLALERWGDRLLGADRQLAGDLGAPYPSGHPGSSRHDGHGGLSAHLHGWPEHLLA